MLGIVRDLMQFFNSGAGGVVKDVKALYAHVIGALTQFQEEVSQKSAITGQALEDLFGLLRLMRLMVETSQPKEIALTMEYFAQSVDVLTSIKAMRNQKIAKEAVEVAQEWLNLKRVYERSQEPSPQPEKETKTASKSPIKRIAEAISSKNNVFADLRQAREEEKNKNRENSAN